MVKMSEIIEGGQNRFSERARKSKMPNANRLWGEDLEQVEAGRLRDPIEITNPNSLGPKNKNLNIAFRFGVNQSGKLRAFGDIKHSRTNEACRVKPR